MVTILSTSGTVIKERTWGIVLCLSILLVQFGTGLVKVPHNVNSDASSLHQFADKLLRVTSTLHHHDHTSSHNRGGWDDFDRLRLSNPRSRRRRIRRDASFPHRSRRQRRSIVNKDHLPGTSSESHPSSTSHLQSLCFPNQQQAEMTCCSVDMELALLRLTTDQLHLQLSTYLTQWADKLADQRRQFQESVLVTLTNFTQRLNTSLCVKPPLAATSSADGSRSPPSSAADQLLPNHDCWHITQTLSPSFQAMLQSGFTPSSAISSTLPLTNSDAADESTRMDLAYPVDNLLLQLLLHLSCKQEHHLNNQSQPVGESGKSPKPNLVRARLRQQRKRQRAEIDAQMRCYKYCQARLDLVLDSMPLAPPPDPVKLVHRRSRRQAKIIRSRRSTPSTPSSTKSTKDSNTHSSTATYAYQYEQLYQPSLLFSVRLTRIVLKAVEFAESLLRGLKDFNAAQGVCMQNVMLMDKCALCSGETLAKPCPGLCSNILDACFQPLIQLHSSWKRFTDATKIAINLIRKQPNLWLDVQLSDLPHRLFNYYHFVLDSHKAWLQPQCAGTDSLIGLLNSALSAKDPRNRHDRKSSSIDHHQHHQRTDSDAERKPSGSQNEILINLDNLMTKMANLWTQLTESLCSTAYQYGGGSNRQDCWNGTARSRFSSSECSFCSTVSSSPNDHSSRGVGDFTVQSPDVVVSTSLTHSPSSLLQFTQPHYRDGMIDNQSVNMLTSSHASLGVGGSGSSSSSSRDTRQFEKALARQRANEILFRASRDLHWSTDSLLEEVAAFNSMMAATTTQSSADSSDQGQPPIDNNQGHGSSPSPKGHQPSSWLQLPTVAPNTNQDHSHTTDHHQSFNRYHQPDRLPDHELDRRLDQINQLDLLAYGHTGDLLGSSSLMSINSTTPDVLYTDDYHEFEDDDLVDGVLDDGSNSSSSGHGWPYFDWAHGPALAHLNSPNSYDDDDSYYTVEDGGEYDPTGFYPPPISSSHNEHHRHHHESDVQYSLDDLAQSYANRMGVIASGDNQTSTNETRDSKVPSQPPPTDQNEASKNCIDLVIAGKSSILLFLLIRTIV